MPPKKRVGRKKFKRTSFGKRAIQSAKKGRSGQKKGTDFLPAKGGKRSSVSTTTVDIPGPGGRTDVAIVPTIRRDHSGKLVRVSPKESVATGDFVRVKGGKTPKAIKKARAKGDKRSAKFSRKLGRATRKSFGTARPSKRKGK